MWDGEDIYAETSYSSQLGSYLPSPVPPFRHGFIGWYTDPVGGMKAKEGMSLSDLIGYGGYSVTLYAHYRHADLYDIPIDEFEIFDCSGKKPDLGIRSIPFVAAAVEKGSEGFSFVPAKSGYYQIYVKLTGEDYDDDFNSCLYAELYDAMTGDFVCKLSRMGKNRCYLNQGSKYSFTIYRQRGSGTKPQEVAVPYLMQIGGDEVCFDFLEKPEIVFLNDNILAWSAVPSADEYMIYRYYAPPPGKAGSGRLEFVAKTAATYCRNESISDD
jgi:hypothetical protein